MVDRTRQIRDLQTYINSPLFTPKEKEKYKIQLQDLLSRQDNRSTSLERYQDDIDRENLVKQMKKNNTANEDFEKTTFGYAYKNTVPKERNVKRTNNALQEESDYLLNTPKATRNLNYIDDGKRKQLEYELEDQKQIERYNQQQKLLQKIESDKFRKEIEQGLEYTPPPSQALIDYLNDQKKNSLQGKKDTVDEALLNSGLEEHNQRKAEQFVNSAEDYGEGFFNLANPATPYYGYTQGEWDNLGESKQKTIRLWAHKQAGQYISEPESAAWQVYINGTDPTGDTVDLVFGRSYKYKSFFGNIQDAKNKDLFDAVEKERDEINGAKGFINPDKIIDLRNLSNKLVRDSNSYSGCDITPSITVGGDTFVIGNLSAISYSIHRDKVPVRTLGRSYAKSYVSGGITIAGTLIFTVFDTHVLNRIRETVVSEVQPGKSSSPLTQQLPPFDVTIFYHNEYGHESYLRIYGIEITDESQTHSINDIYTENQMQFVARDIDLMCKKGSKFTPQALAYGNTTRFSKYNLATPAYRLANLKENESKISGLKITQARLGSEITRLNTMLDELKKSDDSSENRNKITAYTIQRDSMQIEWAKKDSEIMAKENKINTVKASESDITDGQYTYGSQFSDGRDSPFYLNRPPIVSPQPK